MITGIVAHLWQSTLFVGAAWLVALGLRRNRARNRYWIWFTASAKFLIPYSLLVRLGTLLPNHVPAAPIRTEWVTALHGLSQPLMPDFAANAAVTTGTTAHSYLAAGAMALWACGFAAVAICWLRRWTHVQDLRKSARVVSVSPGLRNPVPVMVAPDLIEPGIFGVLRPVLLLPEGIQGRLSQTQLDAILAHEFCHVRHKDNLTAAIHMTVQSIFWFHPLTWWIGKRMLEERERACDEEVLRLGTEPRVYADGILNVCKLYVESPLMCLSGVTGSDLTKRIKSIMIAHPPLKLTFSRRILLTIASLAAVACPIALGILNAPLGLAQQPQPQPEAHMAFEVASVKPNRSGDSRHSRVSSYPNRFVASQSSLKTLIEEAYQLQPFQISGGPNWLDSDSYDVDAKASAPVTRSQLMSMVRDLLASRFKLECHRTTKEVDAFAMVASDGGLKLQEAEGSGDTSAAKEPSAAHEWHYQGTLSNFAQILRMLLASPPPPQYNDGGGFTVRVSPEDGLPVINRTGLSGIYDISLKLVPGGDPSQMWQKALREQLGIKLEKQKTPVDILVIDHVERMPAEN
jgi:bla regulator protein BlaR1